MPNDIMQISTQSNYKKICKEIIDTDVNIRFVGVINDNDRLVTGAVKNNVRFYVDESDREILFM